MYHYTPHYIALSDLELLVDFIEFDMILENSIGLVFSALCPHKNVVDRKHYEYSMTGTNETSGMCARPTIHVKIIPRLERVTGAVTDVAGESSQNYFRPHEP